MFVAGCSGEQSRKNGPGLAGKRSDSFEHEVEQATEWNEIDCPVGRPEGRTRQRESNTPKELSLGLDVHTFGDGGGAREMLRRSTQRARPAAESEAKTPSPRRWPRRAAMQKRFTCRGKEKVNIQWLLYCLVHEAEKIARCSRRYGPPIRAETASEAPFTAD